MCYLLSSQQRRHVPPQTLPVRMGSVSLAGGAVMENRSVQTGRTRLMQSAVSGHSNTTTDKQCCKSKHANTDRGGHKDTMGGTRVWHMCYTVCVCARVCERVCVICM